MKKQKLNTYLLLLLGTLISCFFGFYNRYPFVYSDTGTYLYSGFANFIPWDRTIFYGLFCRHISLETSPWLIIITQSFLINVLLYKTLGFFLRGNYKKVTYLISLFIIVLFTGFSVNVSILLPDIFTSILVLSIVVFLLAEKKEVGWKVVSGILIVYALITHLSHIPILVLVLLLLGGMLLRSKRKKDKQLPFFVKDYLILGGLTFSTLVIVPSVNLLYGDEFRLSGGSHVFMMNHLVENGILEAYLEDACIEKDYKICSYKDNLGWSFIWSDDSPMRKTGGVEANKEEYNEILKDLYLSPKYWDIIVLKNIEYGLVQLFTFSTTLDGPSLEGSAPYLQITAQFPDTWKEYISSRQNRGEIDLTFLNFIEIIVVVGSWIMLLIFALLGKLKVNEKLGFIVLFFLLFYTVSAFVCANLSTVHPRFENRIVWLFPFLCILTMAALYGSKTVAFLRRVENIQR